MPLFELIVPIPPEPNFDTLLEQAQADAVSFKSSEIEVRNIANKAFETQQKAFQLARLAQADLRALFENLSPQEVVQFAESIRKHLASEYIRTHRPTTFTKLNLVFGRPWKTLNSAVLPFSNLLEILVQTEEFEFEVHRTQTGARVLVPFWILQVLISTDRGDSFADFVEGRIEGPPVGAGMFDFFLLGPKPPPSPEEIEQAKLVESPDRDRYV